MSCQSVLGVYLPLANCTNAIFAGFLNIPDMVASVLVKLDIELLRLGQVLVVRILLNIVDRNIPWPPELLEIRLHSSLYGCRQRQTRTLSLYPHPNLPHFHFLLSQFRHPRTRKQTA